MKYLQVVHKLIMFSMADICQVIKIRTAPGINMAQNQSLNSLRKKL